MSSKYIIIKTLKTKKTCNFNLGVSANSFWQFLFKDVLKNALRKRNTLPDQVSGLH